MNDTLIFIYLVFFVMLFASTFAFMWKMMQSTLLEMDRKSVRTYGEAMRAYKPPAPHPEMEGVKVGDELLVYNPDKEDEENS